MRRLHLGPVPPDVDALARRAAERVVGTCGIVRRVSELDPVPGLSRVHVQAAEGPRRMPGWDVTDPPHGTGVSVDAGQARVAAIAESVERYCSMAPPDPRLVVRSSFRDLGGAAVPLSRFAAFSARQRRRCPRLPAAADATVIDWTWAVAMPSGKPVLVPAAVTHFSAGRRPPNDVFPEMVSTGYAAHVAPASAVLNGLCEVLERDALMIAWHNRLPLLPIDASGTEAGDLAGEIAGCGLDLALLAVPTDGPFQVIAAVGTSTHSVPHAVMGAACRPDPVAAAVKALYEVCQVLHRLRARPPAAPRRVRELDHHAAFYALAPGAALLERHLVVADQAGRLRLEGAGAIPVVEALTDAVDALASAGFDVVVSEVTTEDAASAGFRAFRVVVPGMLDISADPRYARLGARRLYEVPVTLGLRRRPLDERRLNLLPVPLA